MSRAEERLKVLEGQLISRFYELFPNYAWTDPETAIDLMAAEIKALKVENSLTKKESDETAKRESTL